MCGVSWFVMGREATRPRRWGPYRRCDSSRRNSRRGENGFLIGSVTRTSGKKKNIVTPPSCWFARRAQIDADDFMVIRERFIQVIRFRGIRWYENPTRAKQRCGEIHSAVPPCALNGGLGLVRRALGRFRSHFCLESSAVALRSTRQASSL